MPSLTDRLRFAFSSDRVSPLEPGMHSYLAPGTDPLNYRMHLRIEPGGEGLLILQASTVLHLNRSATEFAYHFLHRKSDAETAKTISERYRVSEKQALNDYVEFKDRVSTLIETPDLDPVSFLELDRTTPYSEALGAPYRLDAALTYNLPKGSKIDAAPTKRVKRELDTEAWIQVLDKAWNAGIPHVVFTGGEPTLRADLPELLEHAEDLGMVTGLLSDGIKLSDTKYLKSLLDAGLDHAMVVLQPDKKKTWDSLASFSYWKEVLADDVFIAAHLTITERNVAKANSYIDKLADSGISAISLSENSTKLSGALQNARDHADFIDLPLVWDLPVPYSDLNPVSLELEKADGEHPQGAGKAWLYVEPDGDVLPGQGINQKIGNFLKDDWEKIWGNAKGN